MVKRFRSGIEECPEQFHNCYIVHVLFSGSGLCKQAKTYRKKTLCRFTHKISREPSTIVFCYVSIVFRKRFCATVRTFFTTIALTARNMIQKRFIQLHILQLCQIRFCFFKCLLLYIQDRFSKIDTVGKIIFLIL